MRSEKVKIKKVRNWKKQEIGKCRQSKSRQLEKVGNHKKKVRNQKRKKSEKVGIWKKQKI